LGRFLFVELPREKLNVSNPAGGSGKKGSGGGKEGGPKKRASKDDKVKSRTKTSSKKK
jgi:hypothetical protein